MKGSPPFSELDIPTIAAWCTDKIPEQDPKDRQRVRWLVEQLFDERRAEIHKAIRELGIIICNPNKDEK